jgi:hypothetical protein
MRQASLSSEVSGHSRDYVEMEEEAGVHSSEGQWLQEDYPPQTPSIERQVTPPPLEAEVDIEGEDPTPRLRESPPLSIDEQTEERPTSPRDGGEGARTEAEELVKAEAWRENYENQEPDRPEKCRGNSALGTDRPSSSRAQPPLENLG